MKAATNNLAVRSDQGFEVYALSNERVEVAVVPALGAKIVSLKDLRTGREWMWHPAGGRKLFQNFMGDDFANSPLVGMDECLPTIAPCSWQGRNLPDHGEVWAAPWTVDTGAWETGVLHTSVRLKISPFDFERSIELEENEVRLSYLLSSRSPVEEYYLWAMHPLLRLQTGDQLELPHSTRTLLNDAAWVDEVTAAHPGLNGSGGKVFASPLNEGFAAIQNQASGDRLAFEWNPSENGTLGIWLTRGGWHGHHHFALEPANGEPDALTTAIQRKCCGVVRARSIVSWQVTIRVGVPNGDSG